MYKAYKYRLYPTEKQKVLLEKHFGACRFIYNLALETKDYAWRTHRKNVSRYDLQKQLTDLKKEYTWLNEVARDSLDGSILNLDNAYKKFFKGSGFPKYKSKHDQKAAFSIGHGRDVKLFCGKIIIPKFQEGINVIMTTNAVGNILSAVVSKTHTGKYFISVLFDDGNIIPEKQPIEKSLGVDLGLNHFAVTSDGEKIENPKHFQKSLSKLKFRQRQLSKKVNGGNNRKKAKLKVALAHEKITNQRNDFLHKLSTKLVSENQALCFEDLNIEGMRKNRKLAQSISSVSWYEFIRQCKYKCEWTGKRFFQIPRFQASTKVCSNCDAKIETLTLSDREWYCVNCNTLHDRDVNAAINIRNYCANQWREKSVELPVVIRSDEAERHLADWKHGN